MSLSDCIIVRHNQKLYHAEWSNGGLLDIANSFITPPKIQIQCQFKHPMKFLHPFTHQREVWHMAVFQVLPEWWVLKDFTPTVHQIDRVYILCTHVQCSAIMISQIWFSQLRFINIEHDLGIAGFSCCHIWVAFLASIFSKILTIDTH